jgi:hypothetical protein
MDFTPKTEEEISEAGLLPKGEYPFEVIKAEDKKSKNGNAMIELSLCVFQPDGETRKVVDYLLSKVAYKLRHFCDSVGLLPQYQGGTLQAEDCVGRTGNCKIEIKPADSYPAKNEVKDYITRDAKPLGNTQEKEEVEDDDIPNF